MNVSFRKTALEDYIRVLSAREIVPGGGSASAVNGVLAAGLNLMVINFTNKEGISQKIARELEKLKIDQEKLADLFLDLVDKDCKVFKALMRALSEKKNTQEGFKNAASVPIEICRASADTVKITERLLDIGNNNLLSDIGCSCNFIRSAFDSARINARVNINYLKDDKLVQNMNEEIKTLADITDKACKNILCEVSKAIWSK
jgi:formiminotetrahydrofolate cyclodeaminase